MFEIAKALFMVVIVVLATIGIAIVFSWAIKRFDKSGKKRNQNSTPPKNFRH
jgi:uncharacterized membrane protein AbrB (regulator of aidB expression)